MSSLLFRIPVFVPFLSLVVACGGVAATSVVGDGGALDGATDGSTHGDAAVADGRASDCTPACTSDQLCVSNQFEGGPLVTPDDAGACPQGRHLSAGNQCIPDPTFACASKPAACSSGVDCTCAASLCTGGSSCTGTTSNEVDCFEAVP